ncbi:hypothetical protein ACQPZF_21590 [Actinosynnema sp. CS-041913]|uniref:hypothetical protein n=1 Tax=Actinosynnema sp. CS-041913 TaxID=3239917 RepID=UPI003D89B5C9
MTVLDHAVRPDLPTTGWATAQGRRREPADAAAARTSAGRFAIAVSDGIGDTPKAALAARRAVDTAIDTAWRSGVAEAPPAIRRTLDHTAATAPIAVPTVRLPPDDTTTALRTAPVDQTSQAATTTTQRQAALTTTQHQAAPTGTTQHQAAPTGTTPDRLPTPAGDTTFAVAAGDARGWAVAWVGDCRAYLVPPAPDASAGPDPAILLTADHTIGHYLRERGVQAHPGLDRVVTTTARKGDPALTHGPTAEGRLVLVTNGVHHHLDAHTIADITRTVADPAEAASALVAAALRAGGTDNAAAAVADLR